MPEQTNRSVSSERELCRSVSADGIRFCELPLSGLIGVINVELDRTEGVSEHVAIAYDYGRRGYSDEAYEGDWAAVKGYIEQEFPEAPWVKVGLDNPWPGDEADAPSALLAWERDGITVGEFARHYAIDYPAEKRSRLASKILDAVATYKDDRTNGPERRFQKLLEEYRSLSGWQGLSADEAISGFAQFCAEEAGKEQASDPRTPDQLRIKTDLGDLVASFSGDPGIYDGIAIDLEKPDGTSGQIAIAEVVPESAVDDGVYRSRVHTLAYDGNAEDVSAMTEVDIDGEAMNYPPRDPVPQPARTVPEGVFDPKGRIVLMTFEIPGHKFPDALVFDPASSYTPFIVAHGYDASTGEWSHGRYLSDPAHAYYIANPNILEDSATVWCIEDYAAALNDAGIEASPRNIQDLIHETQSMRGWRDRAIEDGNEHLAESTSYIPAAQDRKDDNAADLGAEALNALDASSHLPPDPPSPHPGRDPR